MAAPLKWSEKMERLFNQFVGVPVLKHPGTVIQQDVLLGQPFLKIRSTILREGLANFSQGYSEEASPELSAAELVLLFCFINMKAHYFSNLVALRHHERNLRKLLDEKLLLVDVGCGPGTAALAFIEAFPGHAFNYVGVDCAPAMRDKAIELLRAAQTMGLVKMAVKTHFAEGWQQVKDHQFGADNAVLIVFSYFFASESLLPNDLVSLANIVKKMKGHRPQKPVAILHLNSPRPHLNRHYRAFRKLLGFEAKEGQMIRQQISFQRKFAARIAPVDFVHEFLWL